MFQMFLFSLCHALLMALNSVFQVWLSLYQKHNYVYKCALSLQWKSLCCCKLTKSVCCWRFLWILCTLKQNNAIQHSSTNISHLPNLTQGNVISQASVHSGWLEEQSTLLPSQVSLQQGWVGPNFGSCLFQQLLNSSFVYVWAPRGL